MGEENQLLNKYDSIEGVQNKREYVKTIINEINTDSWMNLISALGTRKDKTIYTQFQPGAILPDIELDSIYSDEGLGEKIISCIPDDMTREWITIENDDKKIIEYTLKKLDAQKQFNLALRWARLFGGSILFIGFMDGKEADQEINIKKGMTIEWLKPISRARIQLGTTEFEKDTKKPNFGKPIIFTAIPDIMGNTIKIHTSRVLQFFGEIVSDNKTNIGIDYRYWGLPYLQSKWDGLKYYGSLIQNIMNIVEEFIIGKFMISGLADKMADKDWNSIKTRMEIVAMYKSVIHGIFLDVSSGEDYIRDSANVGGLPELWDRAMIHLSAITSIPVTRLFGRSPAGMNATGESDETNYYDIVKSKQRLILETPLQQLVDWISIIHGLPGEHPIKFNPLKQVTQKEIAEINKINADVDHIYIQNGVLSSDDVMKMRFPNLEGNE